MPSLFRRLRQWVRPFPRHVTLVLMYHRVADEPWDPFDLCVHPHRFAAQMRHLAARFRVAPLAAFAATTARPRVVLTFDDGYLDTLTCAAPVLADLALPSTVFVTAGLLGRSFWWDRLAAAVGRGRGSRLDIQVDGQQRQWTLEDPAARRRATIEIAALLRPLAENEREAVVAQLESERGATAAADCRAVSVDELRRLAAVPGVEIGAHTLTHPSLACQPEGIQRSEINGSRSVLEEAIRMPVPSFAYPYGTQHDRDARTEALLRAAGFTVAVTTEEGLLRPSTHPLAVPRMAVRNWDLPEFATRLLGFFRSRC